LQEKFYEHSFVFTLNANEDPKNSSGTDFDDSQGVKEQLETFPSSPNQDRYFNCLCIVFNEIISSTKKGTYINAD